MNAIFLLQIKVGTESTKIFLKAPDRSIDPGHEKFITNIESITDKVYVEFYDVIEEGAFNPATTGGTNVFNDMQNLKLLAIKCFDVKDFAFSKRGSSLTECIGHKVLLPVHYSGSVASFTFKATFHAEVPSHITR